MRRAMDIAKHRFKPESIFVLESCQRPTRKCVEDITNGLQTENLRDPKIQEELIDEYSLKTSKRPLTLWKSLRA